MVNNRDTKLATVKHIVAILSISNKRGRTLLGYLDFVDLGEAGGCLFLSKPVSTLFLGDIISGVDSTEQTCIPSVSVASVLCKDDSIVLLVL